MFTFFYGIVQMLGALVLSAKFIWKMPRILPIYFGWQLPRKEQKERAKAPSFLLYAVSMGETRSLSLLYQEIRKTYSDSFVAVASRTITGHEESKRSMPTADKHFLLPFDFSWVMKKLYARLQPDVVIVTESDLWYNFLRLAKYSGAFLCLVSGRISDVSYRRFLKVPFFARKLISAFDLICTQNALFRQRFISLGAAPSNVVVAGNLKLDGKISRLSKEEKAAWKECLGIHSEDRVVVLGSTHDPEEKIILEALHSVWKDIPHLKVLLVPRHPNRFSLVEKILDKMGLTYCRFSAIENKTGKEKVILFDQMGLLRQVYQLGEIAIACGSFASHLKGHNILEPVWCEVPLLFGPYMEDQVDLVSLCLSFGAGYQISLEELPSGIRHLLSCPEELEKLQQNGRKLIKETEGVLPYTWTEIQRRIRNAYTDIS